MHICFIYFYDYLQIVTYRTIFKFCYRTNVLFIKQFYFEYIAINNSKKDKKGIRIYSYDAELVVFAELIILPDCALQK